MPGILKNLNNSGKSSIPVHFQQFGEDSRKEAQKMGSCLLCVVADFRNYKSFLP